MSLSLVTHPCYSYPFKASHRFPMQKFTLLHEYLKEQGIARFDNTFRSTPTKLDVLELAHCPTYLRRFINNELTKQELRALNLPWSEMLVRRTLISPNGTRLACQLALRHGVASHLAGGTHHAHYDYASGFCILNDLAIAATSLLSTGSASKVLIFDVDVHQGDGTARILADEPNAFTCSIHCEKNFPMQKAQSDLDVNVPAGMADEAYLQVVADTFEKALELSQPDFIIYDAGVDVFEDDPLGLLNISMEGLRQRDRYVIKRCLDLGIPVVTVIGGGYDKDDAKVAMRHAIAVEEAHKLVAG